MAKNDFYKNFETYDGTYRSFKSVVARGASNLVTLAPITVQRSRESVVADIELYTNIINALFPVNAGSCLPIEELWEKISELAKANDADVENQLLYKLKISKILRVYYYNGIPGQADPLENEIQQFYEETRPSAYIAPTAVAKDGKARTLLRDMIGTHKGETLETTAKLSMILVDTPMIDIKLRATEKVDAFINYSPTMLISQCVPYVDARFILQREVAENDKISRPLNFMGPLKFLMDSTEQIKNSTANALLYDSSVLRRLDANLTPNQEFAKEKAERARIDAYNKNQGVKAQPYADKNAQTPPADAAAQPAAEQNIRFNTKHFVSGMETFTMPQTLLNMDFDAVTTRYNPIRNPSLPFGTITSFTVNVAPSVGLMSFKTATLVLKIFDRSRLVEIADFINPKLYQAATLWMTYGWRGPQQEANGEENPYIKLINENMMVREAYGIRNTTVSIDDFGVTTITLSLFTKGAAELADVKTDGLGNIFDNTQQKIAKDMARLAELLKLLNIQSYQIGGSDIRGSMLINSANGGTFPEIDAKQYKQEFDALIGALSALNSDEAKQAAERVKDLFALPANAEKDKAVKSNTAKSLQNVASAISRTRFDPLKSTVDKDLFVYFDKKFDKDAFGMPGKNPTHRLAEITKIQGDNSDAEAAKINGEFKFGTMSFGRVFLNYFQQLSTGVEGVIDEFQVIFYRFNSRAGYVASMNIAEFPIDMAMLQKAYTNKITDQKGEKMSIMSFLEIVRESQFNEMRHRAYGFSGFFQYKDGKYIRAEDEQKQQLFIKSALTNVGNAGSFLQPAIDFYIETAYAKLTPDGSATLSDDLLKRFETASAIATSGRRNPEIKKILRIHIYDKASSPHQTAMNIMKQRDSGKFYAIPADAYKQALEEAERVSAETLQREREAVKAADAARAQAKSSPKNEELQKKKNDAEIRERTAKEANENNLQKKLQAAAGDPQDPAGATNRVFSQTPGYENLKIEVYDFGNPASFQKVKNKIAEFVPTILVGSNGTAIKNVNYSSNQDALLSTIMMLRSNTKEPNPAQPNGAGAGGLPLRVIPGQLQLQTLGCPLVSYMQQFFVDLGTGTTIDNLYNVTGLTHTFNPGQYTTDIKFAFADAYGQYESPQSFAAGFTTLTNQLKQEQDLAKKAGRK